MKSFALLLYMLILASCSSTKKTTTQNLNSWIGHHKAELIKAWGPPNTTTSDGNGGEVLVYPYHGYDAFSATDYYEYRMIYVDTDSKIYHWLFRRSPNPPQRVDLKLLLSTR